MQPSSFGHVVNYVNSLIPIRRFLPFRETQKFLQMSTKIRGFIGGLVTARKETLSKGVDGGAELDVLQCLIEHSDPLWNDTTIVEYVS